MRFLSESTRLHKILQPVFRDILVCVAFLIAGHLVFSYFDLAEGWEQFTSQHEEWELDEVPFAIALGSFALAWYAYRRWREYFREAQLRKTINDRLIVEAAERRRAEAWLREVQKLEAVGQLTGGIAHEFNNLLTIVQGNAQLLQTRHGGDDQLDRMISQILVASRRGSDLTHRLLTAGQRQTLKPERIELGAAVGQTVGQLKEVMGENIKLAAIADGSDIFVRIDSGELENAILNLVLNARDAMVEGGTVTVRSGRVFLDEVSVTDHPDLMVGEFATVTVSDTGAGMTEDVRERAFEPFFTTKGLASHSGLGLSMVFGFTAQSGGYVKLGERAEGGTIVTLYLPVAAAEETPQNPEPNVAIAV